MSIEEDIWAALKARANTIPLTPKPPISWPNVAFTKPTGAWLRVTYSPNRNDRLVLDSDGPHRRKGLLQIDCMVQLNSGSNNALEMAATVAAHFPCDLQLTSGSVQLRVTKAPDIWPSFPYPSDSPTHWMVPVVANYETFA